ncbi:hypothetical protein BGZ65_004094 [Modicella reniformis]|uniref:SRA1/Sec31 domain-containing protein n=1 Tax=Modicella reniformis TaxID=1440133 RepID=A0A9P6MBN2_9FUNG|nr:hypothetical protein BGZ65_004094 [Modicella reniformis]
MDTPPASELQTRLQEDDGADEANDNAEAPVWASSSAEQPEKAPAPPPTYDPSVFSAPLNPTPAFKPRKTNRVSVLAYPTDGSQPSMPVKSPSTPPPGGTGALPAPRPTGGPPSLFGPSGAGSPATPPPPASGIKLPPPPMRNVETGSPPVPYTRGDFRTAEIVNHWNDPPTQIFEKKPQGNGATAYDFGPMKEKLAAVIQECSPESLDVPVLQKRMFDDITKRLQVLQEQLDKGTVKERIVKPLSDMIQALSSGSFAECQAIHAKLMQTEFESEGKWLLGFKRLIDLYASKPPLNAKESQ